MAKAMKPFPLRWDNEVVARCKERENGTRWIVVDEWHIGTANRAKRLAAWLTRAAAWVEEGK